jgi:UDP-N-acetylmuramate dehydrogenase
MNFQENIPLAPYTTFKIGGPARFFCEAGNDEEILEALEFAREKNLPVFVMGGGSNILVADKGFDGLVIKIQNSKFKIQNSLVECEAGIALSRVVNESTKHELTGLEWAAGIPGTIGGAVRGNAGAYGGTMADSVGSVKVLSVEDLRFMIYDSRKCEFDYRSSIFKENPNLIILSVDLKLEKGDREKSEKIIKEILKKRKENQPMEFPSPGSFFKNPETNDKELIRQFETDTGKKVTDHVSAYQYTGNKIKIPAPWLIEEVGLKGKRIGGAMVSEKHANFIVNMGGATADNVMSLAAVIKTRVRDRFGIQLQEEVQFVGF